MASQGKKRRDLENDTQSAPKKPSHEPRKCPNCYRRVGPTNYIQCSTCQQRVHVRCTQITTDDVVNETAAFTGLQCNECNPPDHDSSSDIDNHMDAADNADSLTGKLSTDEILRALLKGMRALRRSNARLERQVCDLTEKVEKLTASRDNVHMRGRRARRSPSSLSRSASRSASSQRAARVSFSGVKNSIGAAIGAHNYPRRGTNWGGASGKRGNRRFLRVGDSASSSSSQLQRKQLERDRPTQSTASQLPVARFQMKHKDVFVSNLDKTVTAARMNEHLKAHSISPLKIRKVQPRFATHASFIITVSQIDYPKLFCDAAWTHGTTVMDFRDRGGEIEIVDEFPSAP